MARTLPGFCRWSTKVTRRAHRFGNLEPGTDTSRRIWHAPPVMADPSTSPEQRFDAARPILDAELERRGLRDGRRSDAAAHPRRPGEHPRRARGADRPRAVDRRPAHGLAARAAARHPGRRERLDRRPPAQDLRLQPQRRRRAGRRSRRHPLARRGDGPRRRRAGGDAQRHPDRRRAGEGARLARGDVRRAARARPATRRATCAASASASPARSSSPPARRLRRRSCPAGTATRSATACARATARPCSSTTTSTSWPSASTGPAGAIRSTCCSSRSAPASARA